MSTWFESGSVEITADEGEICCAYNQQADIDGWDVRIIARSDDGEAKVMLTRDQARAFAYWLNYAADMSDRYYVPGLMP